MELVEVRKQWKKLQDEWSVAKEKAREAEQRVATLDAAAARKGLAPFERERAGARALRGVAERYQIEMKRFAERHLGR